MQRLKRFLFILAVLAVSISTAAAKDSSSADLNELLDLLVAKKVITSEEAAAFRARSNARTENAEANAAGPQQNTPAVSASSQVLPTASQLAPSPDPSASNGPTLRFSGYVQGRWTGAPATTNSFEVRRARIT